MSKSRVLILLSSFGLVLGCASGEKADLETGDVKEALSSVEEMRSRIIDNHGDLLAHEDFEDGMDDLDEAQEDYRDQEDAQEVLDGAAQAKYHFQQAEQKARNNKSKVSDKLLQARTHALEAGANQIPDLSDRLEDIDDDLRDETDEFEDRLSVNELSSFQKKYLGLEVAATQHRHLDAFRNIVQSARNNDADDKAPNTLRDAETSIRLAENTIAQNPRQPSEFKDSVMDANKASKLLDDVMNKLMAEAKGAPEAVALKLVKQERRMGELSDTVGNLRGDLAQTEQSLQQRTRTLQSVESDAQNAKAKVRLQEAMNQVRKNFSPQEAEVYQQGERLIIRLKKMNFPSGSSTIPTQTMPLLSKVSNIIEGVDPKNIRVQGHTDSTGGQALNQQLSQERAQAVATYLRGNDPGYAITAQGLGESNPLANNETKSGRALNRRVDIIIDAK